MKAADQEFLNDFFDSLGSLEGRRENVPIGTQHLLRIKQIFDGHRQLANERLTEEEQRVLERFLAGTHVDLIYGDEVRLAIAKLQAKLAEAEQLRLVLLSDFVADDARLAQVRHDTIIEISHWLRGYLKGLDPQGQMADRLLEKHGIVPPRPVQATIGLQEAFAHVRHNFPSLEDWLRYRNFPGRLTETVQHNPASRVWEVIYSYENPRLFHPYLHYIVAISERDIAAARDAVELSRLANYRRFEALQRIEDEIRRNLALQGNANEECLACEGVGRLFIGANEHAAHSGWATCPRCHVAGRQWITRERT